MTTKTITLSAGQVSEIFTVQAGGRITTTGSGKVQFTTSALTDIGNGVATWTDWPSGSTAGYDDAKVAMYCRAIATAAMTVTITDRDTIIDGQSVKNGSYWGSSELTSAQLSAQEFVPANTTYGAYMDALNKIRATGRPGTIRFLPELYDFASAGEGLIWEDGISHIGTPPVMQSPASGSYDDSTTDMISGTIIQGDGIAEGISCNRNALAEFATIANVGVMGADVRGLGFRNWSTALAAGARNNYGISNSVIHDIYVKNCGEGMSLNTSSIISIKRIRVYGGHGGNFTGSVPGSHFLPGNCVIDDYRVYTQGDRSKYGLRFGTFDAAMAGSWGISQVGLVQVNSFARSLVSFDITMASGVADISVQKGNIYSQTTGARADLTNAMLDLPLGMPVVFSVNTANFLANTTYFVVARNVGALTFQLSNKIEGTPLVPNANTGAVTERLFQRGMAHIIVDGCTSINFTYLDLEGEATAPIVINGGSSIEMNIGSIPQFAIAPTDTANRWKPATSIRGVVGRTIGANVRLRGAKFNYEGDPALGRPIYANECEVELVRGVVYGNHKRVINGVAEREGIYLSGNVQDATNYPATLNVITAGGITVVRPGSSIARVNRYFPQTNLNFGDGTCFGTLTRNPAANSVDTLPTITEDARGQPVVFINISANTITLNVAASQNYNNKPGAGSLVIPAYGTLALRALTGQSGYFWGVESASFATGL